MLTSLKIAGFKAVKSAEITFSPLTLLIGRNGSGKSTAIEALQWLQEAMADGLESATSERFGRIEDLINRRTDHVELALKWDPPRHSDQHVSYTIRVKAAASAAHPPIVVNEKCVLGRTTGARWIIRSKKGKGGPAVRSIQSGHPVREGDALAIDRLDAKGQPSAVSSFVTSLRRAVFLRLSPSALAEPDRLRYRGRGPLLDEEGRGLVGLIALMSRAQRERLHTRVANVLESVTNVKVLPKGEQGILTVTERMRSRGGKKNFDISSLLLSEGTRRLVAIFALLESNPRPTFVAIEEIENGLDPWTLVHVFDALRDAAAEGTQIVLTTHSPYLLDHVETSQVVHVRREHGDTSYTPMRSYDEVLKYEGVVAPGAMYVSKYLTRADWRSSS